MKGAASQSHRQGPKTSSATSVQVAADGVQLSRLRP